MEFQDRLYQLRKERGSSQEELADVVGVSRQAVQKWESGASRPDMDNLTILARHFGVTLDYLILGAEVQPPTPSSALHLPYYEYKSKHTLFGLPLVHIKLGNYSFCRAKGILAIGNVATGVVAIGGVSVGGIGLGGVSLGGFAIGGCALGAVALGGLGVGLLAFGGAAIGVFALGGGAIASHIAAGGSAWGHIAIGDGVRGAITFQKDTWNPGTPEAIRAAIGAAYPWVPQWLATLFSLFP